MGNWHSALLSLDCFAKVGRQSLPAWALVHGEPMYSSWNLVATPAVPLAVVLEDRSLNSGSGQCAADYRIFVRKSYAPRRHAHRWLGFLQ